MRGCPSQPQATLWPCGLVSLGTLLEQLGQSSWHFRISSLRVKGACRPSSGLPCLLICLHVSIPTGVIKLKNNGDFFIANEGRRPIYIDGRPVLCGSKWRLSNNSVVEVSWEGGGGRWRGRDESRGMGSREGGLAPNPTCPQATLLSCP